MAPFEDWESEQANLTQPPRTAALAEQPSNKVTLLKNETCLYCGKAFTTAAPTKEHLVGRRFVPKGSLNRAWNLIAYCCGTCNGLKADLEDDLSAILLQPDGLGELASPHPVLSEEAMRKGRKARDRITKKLIQDSTVQTSVPMPLSPGVNATFGFRAPPPVDPQRAARLAWYHVTGLLYLITFEPTTGSGRFPPGVFRVLDQSLRSDWGNAVQRAFAQATGSWKPVCQVRTAGGFFKATIRRHPTADCRSWALEWNRNLRILGALGDAPTVEAFDTDLPQFHFSALGQGMRYREEQRLAAEEDTLFRWVDETHPSP